MKNRITLLFFLIAVCFGKTFAGGPSAPYRFDSTFAQNGFLIDTITGGSNASYIQFKEILVGTGQNFWIGGITNGTFLANKYSQNGSQLVTHTGASYADGMGQTGVISNNKIYLGGKATNGGHYQNIAYNFDGTPNSIFHQTVGADSFLSEPLYGQNYPVGDARSNCSGVLSNGHIVTVVLKTFDSTYITEFDPIAGTTVTTHPQFLDGNNQYQFKALRVIPGTNSYAVLLYNTANVSTIYILTNGVLDATYTFASAQYNAMIAMDATHMLIGGDHLYLFDVTNGSYSSLPATLTGVQQLTRDAQSGEIYAFTGNNIYALTSAYSFDIGYNPDGLGNTFNYAPVNADYWMGSGSSQIFYTDMEMQGSNILISGFVNTLNGHPANAGYAGFVIKIKGRATLCSNFSVALDSVYGTTGCDWNAHISLTGQFPMNAAFSWSSGGGSINTVTTSPFIPTGLCPETYKVVFTDGNGCKDSITFVTPVPTSCVAPVINNLLSGVNYACEGETGQVGSVSVTGTSFTHRWYKDGVAIAGIGGSYATFSAPLMSAVDTGDYYVIVTNSCGADTSNVSHLSMIPSTTPTIQQVGNQLTALGAVAGATFQWYFNNSPLSGATSATYNAAQSGTYSVDAISQFTCTRNSGNVNVTITGINAVNADLKLSIYPNPATEMLVIVCDEEIEAVEVYNVIGEQVIFVKGQITKLNVAPLAQGVYSIQLKTSEGKTTVKKFTKQ